MNSNDYLRQLSLTPQTAEQTMNEPIIGKIKYLGFKGDIAEELEYTNTEDYLGAIKRELYQNPDGFRAYTISKDPELKKCVDDLYYNEFGGDNPHTIEHYEKIVAAEMVPDRFKTEELCLAAVQQDGTALFHVPEELKTKEVCQAAVMNRGIALRYVPDPLKTEDLCLAAVQQTGWTLEMVPHALKNEKICLAAVRQDGTALEGVPEPLRTKEICYVAVRDYGGALQFVPQRQRTPALCYMALYGTQYTEEEREEIKKAIPIAIQAQLSDLSPQIVFTEDQKGALEKGEEVLITGVKTPLHEHLLDLSVSLDKTIGKIKVKAIRSHKQQKNSLLKRIEKSPVQKNRGIKR